MKLIEVISTVIELPGKKLFWDYYSNGLGSNPDLLTRLPYLNPREMENELHFIILDGQTVIADAAIQQSPYEEHIIWLKHIVVDVNYRNKGYARRLLEHIYAYASSNKKQIEHSSFSDLGQQYLPNIIKQLDLKYPEVVKNAIK